MTPEEIKISEELRVVRAVKTAAILVQNQRILANMHMRIE